jgi:hypothetical protein
MSVQVTLARDEKTAEGYTLADMLAGMPVSTEN